jgi:hypothetical protein
MTVRARAGARFSMEQKHGHSGLALLGSNKLMRAANEGQRFLTHMMHRKSP